jgi:hypothetical protein
VALIALRSRQRPSGGAVASQIHSLAV